MQPEQWRSVKALMHALLALPREAREDHLQRHAGDPIVRAETRALLDEYERGELDDFPRMMRFVARRRLGAGAFGAVYEAYDSEQQVVVALKVLKSSSSCATASRRSINPGICIATSSRTTCSSAQWAP